MNLLQKLLERTASCNSSSNKVTDYMAQLEKYC